jgi:hypothetical protein
MALFLLLFSLHIGYKREADVKFYHSPATLDVDGVDAAHELDCGIGDRPVQTAGSTVQQ